MNAITVRITKNYGNEAIYPVCDQAQIFANLLGKKTLSRYDLSQIKALDFEVRVQVPTLWHPTIST